MARVRIFAFLCCALLCAAAIAGAQEMAPSNLGGITLGDKASQYKKRLVLSKSRPVRDAPWVHRIPIRPDRYFTSGYVLVGTCAAPGRVARIKLHYRDGSLPFFRKVSGEMLAKYGDPAEYKGELDGRIMGNKWGFADPWLRPVSLILQRIEGEDPEAGAGNTIKLTNWGLLEAERACWQERHAPAARKEADGKAAGTDNGYLPR